MMWLKNKERSTEECQADKSRREEHSRKGGESCCRLSLYGQVISALFQSKLIVNIGHLAVPSLLLSVCSSSVLNILNMFAVPDIN